MSIGYACLTLGVPRTNIRSCMKKNADEENLQDIISYNLTSLENMLVYNIKNNIRLFRISSDLIPFGSSPVNKLSWWSIYEEQFHKLGKIIKENGIRVSMHPGQYTVLNSPNDEVVDRALEDLNYHTKVLDTLGVSAEHKIILHIGGIYNDKTMSVQRFIANYDRLTEVVKKRLVIENDDRLYNISDVLSISSKLDVPVIFDNLHNKVNPETKQMNENYYIEECRKTWKEKDGKPKIHYSQQNPIKNPGAHSDSIGIDEFLNFYGNLKREDIDIMLEVKDKNLSAVKCINCTSNDTNMNIMQEEWYKYKYIVLEKSLLIYEEMQKLINQKVICNPINFYRLLEEALKKESTTKNLIHSIEYVWRYFEDIVTKKEENHFNTMKSKFQQGSILAHSLKNVLLKLADKYNILFLLDSYYFLL